MHAVHLRCACCMVTVHTAARELLQVGLVSHNGDLQRCLLVIRGASVALCNPSWQLH